MLANGLIAVGVGGALGCWLRWGLSYLLNPIFPTVPLGTLAANCLGGYLIGVAIAFFAQHAEIAPEARLFAITGFMGGLTTFSTFSAEAATLILRDEFDWTLAHVLGHLVGSIGLTLLGIATVKWLNL